MQVYQIGELEEILECVIKRDLTNMNLNKSQPDMINKMNQGFNRDMKSLMTFNAPDITHKGIVSNQESEKIISCDIHKRYRSSIGYLLYLLKHS